MDNEGRDSPFSIEERFGTGYNWSVNGGRADLYEVIRKGKRTPGKGSATIPWELDSYERVLRLGPIDTWLLKRMLKHAWQLDRPVFISQRQMERQAIVTRPTIETHLKRLETLRYIRVASISDPNDPRDRRKRYYMSGILAALSLCIMADPRSDWAKENGGPVSEEYIRAQIWRGPGYEHNPAQFDLDYATLVNTDKCSAKGSNWRDEWLNKAEDEGGDG